MHDVEPRLYPTVIREMIRHENDVTNHRIMWLLIGQGLIANACVGAGSAREDFVSVLLTAGGRSQLPGSFAILTQRPSANDPEIINL